MLYKYAKNLHNGDEIIIKRTGKIKTVVSTEKMQIVSPLNQNGYTPYIRILCDDGSEYLHTDVK